MIRRSFQLLKKSFQNWSPFILVFVFIVFSILRRASLAVAQCYFYVYRFSHVFKLIKSFQKFENAAKGEEELCHRRGEAVFFFLHHNFLCCTVVCDVACKNQYGLIFRWDGHARVCNLKDPVWDTDLSQNKNLHSTMLKSVRQIRIIWLNKKSRIPPPDNYKQEKSYFIKTC